MAKRPAFTLIEVMIVLTIVVSVLAIAWPRMRTLAAKTQFREAAVDFKAACAEARDQAVRSGKPVVLSYQLGKSRYRLSDQENSQFLSKQTIDLNPANLAEKPPDRSRQFIREFALPAGITFADPADLLDQTEANELRRLTQPDQLRVEDRLIVGQQQTIDWAQSEAIRFFPEGRATSATVHLRASDTQESITVAVRGLNAEVSIGSVEQPDASQARPNDVAGGSIDGEPTNAGE